MRFMLIGAVSVLAGIAALHTYWGLGGRWPGRDEVSLANLVIGSPTGRMPSPAACLAVAGAIMLGVTLIIATTLSQVSSPWDDLIRLGAAAFAAVFLARGFAGYIPMLWRYAEGSSFHRLNTLYYSPLCLLIAVSLGAALIFGR